MGQGQNVLGQDLEVCCCAPMTGWYRNGFCQTDAQDRGSHTVCAEMTEEFLRFSRDRGNDLITPRPEFNFPGLKPGDRWCVCAGRWQEALEAGVAPPVVLQSTEKSALRSVSLADLQAHALPV